MSAKYHPTAQQRGFALVLALSMMAFVVLLILSMSFLVGVETATVSNELQKLRSRESAKLALYIALGDLQKHAGPDSRVTARADLLGNTVQNGERYWTGVWDTNRPDAAPIWLVSGNNPNPSSSNAKSIEVLGSGSTDLIGGPFPDQSVSAPSIELTGSNDETTDQIAWWISDEGVKASIGSLPLNSRPNPNFLDAAETAATELQVANMHGIEEILPAYNRFDSADTTGQDQIQSLSDISNLSGLKDAQGALSYNSDEAPIHALAPASYGVLANTLPDSEPDSGLMRDLSLYPRLLGTGLEEYLLLGETNEAQLSGEGVNGLRLFTDIQGLDDLPALNDGDIALPIAPVLSNFMIAFTVRSESPVASNPNFYLRMRFFCEFWNPYTHSLKMVAPNGDALELELEVTGLPTVTVSKTTGSLASSAPISIQNLIGDPSHPNRALIMQLDYDPTEDWLPGQSKNWNGVDATQSTGTSPYLSIDRFNKQIGTPEYNLGGATGLDTAEPRLSANIRHSSIGTNDISVRVYLKNTVSGLKSQVAELDGFAYEPVSTRPSGYSNAHSGATFGYHILLRSPHHSADDAEYFRGLWLHDHDPRNIQPNLNDDWYLDNDVENNTGSAYVPVKDGVSPLAVPLPEEISETTNTLEISDFRRLHDNSLGSTGDLDRRLWQDAPLFELPRQRLLSLASLQHVYFHNERPFQIGNSWGSNGSINSSTWFDRYYFSGFSRTDDANDFNASSGPPNPALASYTNNGSSSLSVWQSGSRNDQTAALQPAEELMVTNRFNLNSTSIAAWKAILGSLRLDAWNYLNYPEDDTSDLSGLVVSNTSREGMFARFSQSLAETYEATETPRFEGNEPVAPSAFYRHGARRLSSDQLEALATEIVRLLQQKTVPFMSMEDFISVSPGTQQSLLEQAIANVLAPGGRQQWYHDWELDGDAEALNGNSIDIDHFSPGFLTQADILTAIGPMLSTRSDTFKIRARGDSLNALGEPGGSAALEAIVQRLPEPVDSATGTSPFGRQFKLLSVRWLNLAEL